MNHQPITLEHPRRTPAVLVSLAAMAVIAAAVPYYFWFNFDRSIEPGSSKEIAATKVADPEAGATLKDLQSAQQQTTSEIKAINQNIAATQAELKRMSDQLSALAARVEALQDVTSSIPRPPNARAQALTPPGKKPSQTAKPANSVPLPTPNQR